MTKSKIIMGIIILFCMIQCTRNKEDSEGFYGTYGSEKLGGLKDSVLSVYPNEIDTVVSYEIEKKTGTYNKINSLKVIHPWSVGRNPGDFPYINTKIYCILATVLNKEKDTVKLSLMLDDKFKVLIIEQM